MGHGQSPEGIRVVVLSLLPFVALLALAVSQAQACSVIRPDGPVLTHEEYVRGLDAIVIVRRLEETAGDGFWPAIPGAGFGTLQTVEVMVEDWIKGSGPDRLVVEGVNPHRGWCGGADMPPEGRLILELHGNVDGGTATLSHAEEYSAVRRKKLEAILQTGQE